MNIVFRSIMALAVGLYRATGGALGGKMPGIEVLLLTTTGRKSGQSRTIPLGYFRREGGYLIVASNNGRPFHPGWYFNLQGNPQATIQVMDKVIPVTAEVLAGDARAQAWKQVTETSSTYAGYQVKTTRQIPVVMLHPR